MIATPYFIARWSSEAFSATFNSGLSELRILVNINYSYFKQSSYCLKLACFIESMLMINKYGYITMGGFNTFM